MPDHVHMPVSIPPKHAVSHVVGFLKGKSSIWIEQNILRSSGSKSNISALTFNASAMRLNTSIVGCDDPASLVLQLRYVHTDLISHLLLGKAQFLEDRGQAFRVVHRYDKAV